MSSRPWRDERHSPPKTSGPLIPSTVVRVTTQRLLATAAFFLLQGVKLSGSRTSLNFILFSALDAAFVYLLPVFAIPRFNFKQNVITAQIAALLALNYSVFISSEWLWTLIWIVLSPFLSVLGLKGPPGYSNTGPYDTGLIQGKYIVDILPEASAKLDTIAPLCLDPQRRNVVYMRLTLENTWPSAVQLSRAELGNTSEYENLVINQREIAKLPSEQESSTLYLPAHKPGAYYLDKIVDENTGLRVKVQRQRIVIPPCPSLELKVLSDPLICQEDEFKAAIEAHGVSPLRVSVNGQWLDLGTPLEDDQVARLTHQVIQAKGATDIRIDRIKDRLGCEVQTALSASVRRLRRATAKPSGPQRLAKVHGNVNAHFHIIGDDADAPFTLVVEGPEGPNDLVTLRVPSAGLHAFQLDRPGRYTLKSLDGSRCRADASGEYEVFVPPPLALDVDFKVVEDKCAGPTGIDAALQFHGTGPFKVGYRTLKGTRVISHYSAQFEEPNGVVNFRPKDVGLYKYEIVSVEDQYRQMQFKSDDKKYFTVQQITELPGAQFLPLAKTTLCGESRVSAEVQVRGRGPFNLKYSVDDENEYTISTGETTDKDKLKIDLDLGAGRHFIRLISLTDRNNCVTELPRTRTPDIIVHPELPHVAWDTPADIKSAEPMNKALKLRGEHIYYPAYVKYELVRGGLKRQYEAVLNGPEDTIRATEPGSYRILSMSDNTCEGTVDSESLVNISLYERPRIEIDSDSIAVDICHNSALGKNKPFTARGVLYGEGPFTVVHESVNPVGASFTKTYKFPKQLAEFELATDLVGEYTHYLWVMDTRYPDFNRPQYAVFKHKVHPTAEAALVTKQHKLQVCENSELKEAIPLALKGTAPFQLKIQVGREVKMINVDNSSKLDLRQYVGTLAKASTQKVKVLSVSDVHGCESSWSANAHLNQELDIEVLPQPKLPSIPKTDYCVGETFSFKVSSSLLSPPPAIMAKKLRVDYQWGTKRHQAVVPDRSKTFEKYLSSPGNLSLLAITDYNGCSNVLSEPQLVARVHPLPKSTITEQPHFSIYQGDQISLGFAFQGTAPFSFKYTRSVNGKVVERKEVKNIMEHEYNIIVEEGGEYEIVELHDKYCFSER